MNAYKLADEMMKFYKLENDTAPIQIFDLAANMLRKQAKKLGEKDDYIKILKDGINELNTTIYKNKMASDEVNRKKNERIAELEKELLYTKTMQGVTFK